MSAIITTTAIVTAVTTATAAAVAAAIAFARQNAVPWLFGLVKERLFPRVRIRNLREDVTTADGALTCWYVVKVTNKTTHNVGIEPLKIEIKGIGTFKGISGAGVDSSGWADCLAPGQSAVMRIKRQALRAYLVHATGRDPDHWAGLDLGVSFRPTIEHNDRPFHGRWLNL